MKYGIMIVIFSLVMIGVAVNNVHGETSLNNSPLFEDGKNMNAKNISNVKYNYFSSVNPLGYGIIATYGKLPELDTEGQKQNWSNSLKELGEGLRWELFPKYIYPNGEILTTGENSRGYFVVVFYKNLTVEKPLIEEIYELIDEKAKKMGIQEVPVEFGSGVFPAVEEDIRVETEKKADEEYEKNGRMEPEVIATYGKLPELKTEEQRWNWFYKDQEAIAKGLRNKTSPFLYPSGPIISIGRYADGYFVVAIYKNFTVDRPLLDEIYGLFDEEAKKRGIYEVPVRFILEDFVQPDVEIVGSNEDVPAPDETGNAVPSSDNTTGKSVPGLGLLEGLVSLFSGWLFRRK